MTETKIFYSINSHIQGGQLKNLRSQTRKGVSTGGFIGYQALGMIMGSLPVFIVLWAIIPNPILNLGLVSTLLLFWAFAIRFYLTPTPWFALRLAKTLGYDHVEFVPDSRMINMIETKPAFLAKLIERAEQLGLTVSFHNPWNIPHSSWLWTVKLGIMKPPSEAAQHTLFIINEIARQRLPCWMVIHSDLFMITADRIRPRNLLPWILVEPAMGGDIPDDVEIVADPATMLDWWLCTHGGFSRESYATLLADLRQVEHIWKDLLASFAGRIGEIHRKNTGATWETKDQLPNSGVLPLPDFFQVLEEETAVRAMIDEMPPVQWLCTKPWLIVQAITSSLL